jgi:hypothetical protein
VLARAFTSRVPLSLPPIPDQLGQALMTTARGVQAQLPLLTLAAPCYVATCVRTSPLYRCTLTVRAATHSSHPVLPQRAAPTKGCPPPCFSSMPHFPSSTSKSTTALLCFGAPPLPTDRAPHRPLFPRASPEGSSSSKAASRATGPPPS